MNDTETLKRLAMGIRCKHKMIHSDPDRGGRHAALCGARLMQAQRLVKRGEWVAWVNANAPVTYSQARKYMLIAKRFPEWTKEIDLKSVANLFSDIFCEA